jgi:hypothetical protein
VKVKIAREKANTSKEHRRDCTKRAVSLFFVHSPILEKSIKIWYNTNTTVKGENR